MKKPKLKIVGVVIAMLMAFSIVSVGAAPVEAEDTVMIKGRTGDTISELPSPRSELQYAFAWGRGQNERYATLELVAIDGVPWQDTEIAAEFKRGMEFDPEWYLTKHPDIYNEIVLDKRFNGYGHFVVRLYNEGKSVAEIKEIILNKAHPEFNEVEVDVFVGTTENSIKRGVCWYIDHFDAVPFISNGRVMVPVRGVMEEFGATVEWLPATSQASIKYKDKNVKLKVGSKAAEVNGKTVALDVPATIKDGRTFIPTRFVAEQLGLTVGWNEQYRYAYIRNF